VRKISGIVMKRRKKEKMRMKIITMTVTTTMIETRMRNSPK